jgi:hypothetical protein
MISQCALPPPLPRAELFKNCLALSIIFGHQFGVLESWMSWLGE